MQDHEMKRIDSDEGLFMTKSEMRRHNMQVERLEGNLERHRNLQHVDYCVGFFAKENAGRAATCILRALEKAGHLLGGDDIKELRAAAQRMLYLSELVKDNGGGMFRAVEEEALASPLSHRAWYSYEEGGFRE